MGLLSSAQDEAVGDYGAFTLYCTACGEKGREREGIWLLCAAAFGRARFIVKSLGKYTERDRWLVSQRAILRSPALQR